MEKIIVSACLLGIPCRYDGKSKPDKRVMALMDKYDLVPECAEELGGLNTPRPPAEIVGNRVINCEGADVTEQYSIGALRVLEIAREKGCKIAVLKSKSPSCSNSCVYDGSFTRTLRQGRGICADLLIKNGIRVINEEEIDLL